MPIKKEELYLLYLCLLNNFLVSIEPSSNCWISKYTPSGKVCKSVKACFLPNPSTKYWFTILRCFKPKGSSIPTVVLPSKSVSVASWASSSCVWEYKSYELKTTNIVSKVALSICLIMDDFFHDEDRFTLIKVYAIKNVLTSKSNTKN